PGAADVLEEALAILEPSGQWVILAPCFTGLARARALLGNHDGAAAFYARAHALWRSTQDRGTVVLVLLEGCLFHADHVDARCTMEWAEDLARVAGHVPVPGAAAAAAHARGAALAAQGSYAAALGPLGNPVQRWKALGRLYEAARAQAALRAGSLATSPRDQARRAERSALHCWRPRRSHGYSTWDTRARSLTGACRGPHPAISSRPSGAPRHRPHAPGHPRPCAGGPTSATRM